MENPNLNNDILNNIKVPTSDKYLLEYKQRTYQVGRILYLFIVHNKYLDMASANNLIDEELKNNVDKKREVVASYNNFLNHIKNRSLSNNSYIFLKVTLFNKNITNQISRFLHKLYERNIFILTMIAMLAVNITFIVSNRTVIFQSINLTTSQIILFYISLIFILVAHELGHSSASYFFKIPPNEIGFGFYLIFPVLYSNVSKIWALNKSKKIKINLGGIYFQLIFGTILMVLHSINPYNKITQVLETLIKVNLIIFIYSLIPFIRNDGYWIYSDICNIPNLNEKSNKFPFRLISEGLEYIKMNPWLAIYSAGNYIFISFIILSAYRFISNTFYTHLAKKDNLLQATSREYFQIIICIGILMLFVRSFYKWLKGIITEYSNNKRLN